MFDLTDPIFSDKDAARKHLERIRWPNGPFCPHCGEAENVKPLKGKSHRPGLHKCYSCKGHFSVTVGTVFERSKVPLHKWVLTAHLIAASKKGISAHQIHRMIGVTYKTAWFMCHRIRKAMTETPEGKLGSGGGTVEADETFWGNNKPRGQKKGRGYHHKMKIVSLVERGGKKRSFQTQRVSAATLAPILREHISPDAHLMTDEMSSYTKVGREFASHGITSHSKGQYVDGNNHSNTVEASFSLLKRGLVGTYVPPCR